VHIGAVSKLLEHKVSNIGPRYFCLNRRVSSAELTAIDTGSGAIGEYRGSDDDPIQRALHDVAFLDFLVLKEISENEGHDNDIEKQWE
jgi:hypothetical protein